MAGLSKHIFSRLFCSRTHRLALQLFWAFLLLVHMNALAGLVASLADGNTVSLVIRALGLGLAAVVCGLKMVDAPLLRLVPGWRSAVAAWVAVAMLHLGVLDRTRAVDLNDSAAQVGVVLGVAGVVGSSTITGSVRRFLLSARGRHAHSRTRLQPGPIGRAVACWFVPSSPAPALGCGPPRAPPLA